MMFGDKILKYKDELLADLNTLIGFESVANEKARRMSECNKFYAQESK